jgi:hypothetical protein
MRPHQAEAPRELLWPVQLAEVVQQQMPVAVEDLSATSDPWSSAARPWLSIRQMAECR